MWKTLSDWLLAFLNMARELQEHRTSLRNLEDRMRDMEEAIKLLAQEQRHSRDMEATNREKLLLQLERELTKHQPVLPAASKRKKPRKK